MPPDWHKEWILALMVEGELSPDHSGSIVEIATRFRERFGALTLLLRAAQRPAPIRSIQMRSTNRGRLESLPGHTLGSTQLLSQFSHVATQTSHTLKWSLHGENVPDVDPLDAARRGIGMEISSTSPATAEQFVRIPDYPTPYQPAPYTRGLTNRDLTSALSPGNSLVQRQAARSTR